MIHRFVRVRSITTPNPNSPHSIGAIAAILCKASVRYIDVICMPSAMLNVDTLSHRCVLMKRVLACDQPPDLSLVSSTICCTNSTPFPSSCPPPCCPTSADALVSFSSQGQGTFTRKEPFGSGTSWSSSSISRAYGITLSSAPQKDRHLYLTSSGCVRCYPRLHARF